MIESSVFPQPQGPKSPRPCPIPTLQATTLNPKQLYVVQLTPCDKFDGFPSFYYHSEGTLTPYDIHVQGCLVQCIIIILQAQN